MLELLHVDGQAEDEARGIVLKGIPANVPNTEIWLK
jgi:hypothetical protein